MVQIQIGRLDFARPRPISGRGWRLLPWVNGSGRLRQDGVAQKKRVRKEEGKRDYLGRNKGTGRGRSHGREESKKGKGFLFISSISYTTKKNKRKTIVWCGNFFGVTVHPPVGFRPPSLSPPRAITAQLPQPQMERKSPSASTSQQIGSTPSPLAICDCEHRWKAPAGHASYPQSIHALCIIDASSPSVPSALVRRTAPPAPFHCQCRSPTLPSPPLPI